MGHLGNHKIVTSYVNPDLDGVATAVAISVFSRGEWQTCLYGNLDSETEAVLEYLCLAKPTQCADLESADAIWLVDTHHIKQLAPGFPTSKVVRITDHHPAGDSQSFQNAKIQNENVGAAATLIVEAYQSSGDIPSDIAILLQCAIYSNTLGFKAASTSPRDSAAFKVLGKVAAMPEDLISRMRDCRRALLRLPTPALLERDSKQFASPIGNILVCQIEAPGAMELLFRNDLVAELAKAAEKTSARCAILNISDTEEDKSAIVATHEQVRGTLARHLKTAPDQAGIVRVNRVLQRKSDIVPAFAFLS
jgi:inorganic pyrophosphatase/exopolyphosphatase